MIYINLCKYKNILGKPGKGLHFHIFGLAIIDILLTFLSAWIIQKILLYLNFKIKYLNILLFLFICSIFLHKLFCVETTINKLIFNYK